MRSLASVFAVLVMAAPLAAQQDVIARAFDLERQGRHADAGAAYRQVLQRDPLSAPALLGAERVYTQLGRRDSILAMVRRTLAVDSTHAIARTIEVRTARALGGEPAAAEALRRWMAAAPTSEGPHRELVRLLLASGRNSEAREAVQAARARLNDPARLRPEMAQVEQQAGNWAAAAREWRSEVLARPDVFQAAVFNLQSAPVASRDALLRALAADTLAIPRRLAAELQLGWNEPARAWQLLRGALPAARDERITALRTFAERARSREGPEAQRIAAAALEQLATLVGPAEAARFRIESARAFADAGDPQAARRVLRAMADDPAAPAGVGQSATATLVELYVGEGEPADAAQLLARNAARLGGTEVARLNLLVAHGWVRKGDLARAERTIDSDSSLAADEQRGWIALYRGDGARAAGLLRGVVPRPGDRDRPADRAGVVALLQALETDSVPELGAALFAAARGDTAAAARVLTALARRPRRGTPELLAFTARFLELARDSAGAESLWSELAERHSASAPAPAAVLALARAAARRGDTPLALSRLEHLILTWPSSALVPEARRELDRVRGLVPRT
jgi:tetratricopeptide (TPR) repeat protein